MERCLYNSVMSECEHLQPENDTLPVPWYERPGIQFYDCNSKFETLMQLFGDEVSTDEYLEVMDKPADGDPPAGFDLLSSQDLSDAAFRGAPYSNAASSNAEAQPMLPTTEVVVYADDYHQDRGDTAEAPYTVVQAASHLQKQKSWKIDGKDITFRFKERYSQHAWEKIVES